MLTRTLRVHGGLLGMHAYTDIENCIYGAYLHELAALEHIGGSTETELLKCIQDLPARVKR